MKKFLNKIMLMAVLAAMMFTSCVNDDFDVPDIIIPSVDFSSNMSIADLKASYSGGLDSIANDNIIQGIVVANDESGNYYKTIIIQDGSAGIEVKINRTDMYTQFKVGQKVFIKCKGLYLGNYGGLTQLGCIYNDGIGQIPDVMVNSHVFIDSLPGVAPAPVNLTIPTLSPNYLSMLVKLDNVHFVEAGTSTFAGTETTNRIIEDAAGNRLILRTSSYASFAADTLPLGSGSIVGILSIYGGNYQLYIRDMNDIVNWN